MTTTQLNGFNAAYLVGFLVVAVLTRATGRRIAGALAGGVAFAFAGSGIIALGENQGWWHFVIPEGPYALAVLEIGFVLVAFVYLITWRIARRFGGRGLFAFAAFAAIIGPPRDYWYMRHFPEWGSYGPGIAPVLAISATYALMIVLGHGVMRLVAGPAGQDRLARRPWEPA